MLKSIKSKFIALSLITIILSVGIPMGFLLHQVRANFYDRSLIMVGATIDLMIYNLENSMMRGDGKDVQKIVEHISKNQNVNHIRIFNKSGTIKYSSLPNEIGKSIEIIEPRHFEEKISQIRKREIYLDNNTNTYTAIQPIMQKEKCQTCHRNDEIHSYLDVDTDLTKAEVNFYTGSYHMIFLGIALIIILAFSFYLIFNKFINRPLSQFTLALEEVERDNLDVKLPIIANDEFSILNYHYNRMVNELKYSREKINEMHFDQLQRADKMVTLGELTASMAHDINNHSAIIMSRADYLLYKAENSSELSKCMDDLKVINDQIEKISKITGNILKHSKKLSKVFTKFDLVKIVDNSTEMLEPLIKKRKINLIKNIKVDNAFINGDPDQIEQVILNLISNAVDALKKEGTIKVGVQLSNNNKTQLIVADDGIGIEGDSIDKIFSPFYTNKEAR